MSRACCSLAKKPVCVVLVFNSSLDILTDGTYVERQTFAFCSYGQVRLLRGGQLRANEGLTSPGRQVCFSLPCTFSNTIFTMCVLRTVTWGVCLRVFSHSSIKTHSLSIS